MLSFNSQIFIEPNLYQTLCWAPRRSLPSRSPLEELQRLPAPLLKRLREKETELWRVRKQYLKPDTWPKNENILHSSREPNPPFWPCQQGRPAIPAKQLFIYLFFIVVKYTYHKICHFHRFEAYSSVALVNYNEGCAAITTVYSRTLSSPKWNVFHF